MSGLMNAADYYGLDELKYACNGFIQVNIKYKSGTNRSIAAKLF